MTQAIIDAQGRYLSSLPDGASLPKSAPAGASLVPSAPDTASATWNGSAWVDPAPVSVTAPLTAFDLAAVLLQKGLLTSADVQPSAVSTAVSAQPVPLQPITP